MRWWVVVLAASGCDKVLSLLPVPDAGVVDTSGDSLADAVPACSAPVRITASGIDDTEPAQRADEKELFLARGQPGSRDIASGTRSAVTLDYASLVVTLNVNSSVDDYDPNPSGDATHLFFISTRLDQQPRVFEATRTTNTTTFNPAQMPAGLDAITPEHIAISPDANTLYYTQGGALYMTTRATAGQPFAAPLRITDGIEAPSLPSKGLAIYYEHASGPGIFVRTRATSSQTFGPESLLLAGGYDPGIAFAGHTLVYDATGGLYTVTCD